MSRRPRAGSKSPRPAVTAQDDAPTPALGQVTPAGRSDAPDDPPDTAARVFAGAGEMRARCRAFDWSATPLGPVEQWPVSLRTAAAITLGSTFPTVLVWGPELVQLYNDAYIRLIGRKHPDALGQPTHRCWPEIRHQQEPIFDRVFHGETVHLSDAPYRLERGPGGAPEVAHFTASFVPVPLEHGGTGGSLSTLFETTDQLAARALEAERLYLVQAEREARAMAETANRAKSDFLAVMSHELRTPLNAIAGYAELLAAGLGGPVTPLQLDYIARMQRSERHLHGLINEVLSYAKIEMGALQYTREPVLASDALLGAETMVGVQAGAKGVALAVHPPPAGLGAVADAEKLRQILVNLLSNAVKFTEPGGRIDIATDAVDGQMRIAVADTGIGIPADKLERIFEPFVQLNADLTRTAHGAGLGLAISRTLARGMGGDLSVTSTVGAGSTFVLTLPLAP